MFAKSGTSSSRRLRLTHIVIGGGLMAAAWIFGVLWWRQTGAGVHMPTGSLLLASLPPLAWLLSTLVTRNGNRSAAEPLARQAHADRVQMEQVDAEARTGTAVIGCWAACTAAADARELAAGLSSRRIRPTPDEFMVDDDGLPIPSGRVRALDLGRVLSLLGQLETEDAPPARDALTRSLALLDRVLAQALAQSPMIGGGGTDIALTVKLVLPEAFSPAERTLAARYAAARLRSHAAAVEVLACDSGSAALEQIHEAGLDQANAGKRALLLLACDSALCPDVISALRDGKRLFEPRRPEGLMPGEAAFAVLCASEAAIAAAGLDSDVFCRFASLRSMDRASAAEATSGVTHEELSQAVAGALGDAGVSGAGIAGIACDADHRLSRTLESLGAIAAHVPHLYDIRHRLATNEACGHLGAASALAALVAGAAQAGRVQGPVLVLSISHSVRRSAVVLVAPRRKSSFPHHQAA